MSFAAAMLVALAIDAAIGWPDRLYRRIGHPVTWIGALIDKMDRAWNSPERTTRKRRILGTAAAGLVIGIVGAGAALLQMILPAGWPGVLATGVLAWPFIALRSLHQHVLAVARPLAAGDLTAARAEVAMIVGREPSLLDQAGVARAATESLAENASDGIVAPVFWGVVAGLPGIAAYKAINTLDSMIGHRTPRHAAFGWSAARLDDLVNLIPARLTGLLLALAGGRPVAALACMMRDARRHRSPNAGWPEAAMAGALGIRLSGPRVYADRVAEEPWINGDAPDPDATALERALACYRRAMLLMAAGLAFLVFAL